ncbi:glycosyltransferase family 2 protein [Luteimonas sp. 22616]|uniref:glycosyltransferase family 2 protein n=1 Tax=Luteimonas sp. 22616 TaxID=3453951 RepID=UPI003F84CA2F
MTPWPKKRKVLYMVAQSMSKNEVQTIHVVVPCYRARSHILEVLSAMPDLVSMVHVVDDACPEQTGSHVQDNCRDPRVRVHFNDRNLGVGGAVLRGYEEAMACSADLIVKIDGDGQMDPALIPSFIAPILRGTADYTKGNRFFDLSNIHRMPPLRIFGNAVLSFMAKLSTGYWDIFDPTNGYTAIHASVAKRLPRNKISQRYFFESDILFRLNTLRAVVVDVPMDARYGEEISNLKVSRVVGDFLLKHVRNFTKRIFYNFFLRDLSIASFELVVGVVMMSGGATFGTLKWIQSARGGYETTAGSVMLAALPLIIGLQFLLAFLSYDIASVPRRPIQMPREPHPRAPSPNSFDTRLP